MCCRWGAMRRRSRRMAKREALQAHLVWMAAFVEVREKSMGLKASAVAEEGARKLLAADKPSHEGTAFGLRCFLHKLGGFQSPRRLSHSVKTPPSVVIVQSAHLRGAPRAIHVLKS